MIPSRDTRRERFFALGGYAGAGVREARRFHQAMRPPGGAEIRQVEDCKAPGNPAVRIRIYHPDPGRPLPALVWTHGGGWCIGDLDTTDTVCRCLSSSLSCVVVSVDHRRSPEHPFPAPLDDVATVMRWVLTAGGTSGIDTQRVAVGGESSGANLTLAALLQLRAGGWRVAELLAHQTLIAPVADLADRPSMCADLDPGLRSADLQWFISQYVPDKAKRDDPRVLPLLATSLGGLPTATVVTAGLDPLRDSGAALADRLARSGVATTHLDSPDASHGMLGDLSVGSPGYDAMQHVIPLLALALRGPDAVNRP
jgi:acetyl esterase